MNGQTLIELAGFIVILGGLLWSAAYSRGRSERIETDFGRRIDENAADLVKAVAEFIRMVEASRKEAKDGNDSVWRWKQKHEEDSELKRREYDRELTTLKVTTSSMTVQSENILRRLDNIEILLKDALKK